MPNSLELIERGGHLREFVRKAPQGGNWIDPIFDEIVSALDRTRLEDLTLTYGAASANVVATERGVQLNVRWERHGGWQCFTAPDYDTAIRDMWANKHRVAQIRNGTYGV